MRSFGLKLCDFYGNALRTQYIYIIFESELNSQCAKR